MTDLTELTLIATAALIFVVFIAAFVRGFSGFGFSAVLMAGLVFRLPPSEIVPLSIALEVLASIGQARGAIHHVNKRFLAMLLIAGLFGNPLGVYILGIAPEDQLRTCILLFILLATLVMLIKPVRLKHVGPISLIIAGFLAGVINGATALSGLVLVLFFSTTALSSAAMRATMIAYFFFTDLWAGGLLVAAGHFDIVTLYRVLLVLPALAAGLYLGTRRFQHTQPEQFKTLALWLLLGLCLLGLARSFFGIS